jgi:NaMN:DMB phosphoribosyltransferase
VIPQIPLGASRLVVPTRERRVLIGGMVFIATLLAALRGVPAWRRWIQDTRASASEAVQAATRATALVRVAKSMRDSLAVRNSRYLALAPTLLVGTTPAAAGATLAGIISAAAAASAVKLESERVRTVGTPQRLETSTGVVGHRSRSEGVRSAFLQVRVQANVICDIRGLTALLTTLERGPLRLVVRELSVTQSDPVGKADRPEILRASLTVEGLALAADTGSQQTTPSRRQ